MGSAKNKIGNIGKFWAKAKESGGADGFGEAVPLNAADGPFSMQIIKAEIGDFGDTRKIMTKWVVIGHDTENGTICTHWEGIADEERLVWLQRMLSSLGVDLDEVTIDDEDDLLAVYAKLIEDQTVAKVKVVEKDGWTNMRIQKKIDVDSGDLVDPEEAVKAMAGGGDKSEKKGSKDKKKEESNEVEVEEGDTITFKHGGKKVTGEVVGFDGDDNPKAKVDGEKKAIVVPLDEVLDVEKAEGGKGGANEKEKAVAEEDDIVIVNHKKKDVKGVVTKVKNGAVWVKIKGESEPIQFDEDEVKFEVD